MKIITKAEREVIGYISEKIDKGTANVLEYDRYEELLLKAGVSLKEVRTEMYAHGFETSSQYYNARLRPANKNEREIVEIKIVASLVVLNSILDLLVSAGQVEIVD